MRLQIGCEDHSADGDALVPGRLIKGGQVGHDGVEVALQFAGPAVAVELDVNKLDCVDGVDGRSPGAP